MNPRGQELLAGPCRGAGRTGGLSLARQLGLSGLMSEETVLGCDRPSGWQAAAQAGAALPQLAVLCFRGIPVFVSLGEPAVLAIVSLANGQLPADLLLSFAAQAGRCGADAQATGICAGHL